MAYARSRGTWTTTRARQRELRLDHATIERDVAWTEIVARVHTVGVVNPLAARDLRLPFAPKPDPRAGLRDDAPVEEIDRRTREVADETRRMQEKLAVLASFAPVFRPSNASPRVATNHPLGAPPRRVPFSVFFLELFAFDLWALLLVGVFVTGSFVFDSPASVVFAALAIAWAALFLVVRLVGALGRVSLLRHGKPATKTTRTSKASLSRMRNFPMPVAAGWDVRVELYSGQSHLVRVGYTTEEGATGEVTFRGVPHSDGVVIYDARDPKRALPLEGFRCAPRPNASGESVAGTAARYLGALVTAGAISACVAAGVVVLAWAIG